MTLYDLEISCLLPALRLLKIFLSIFSRECLAFVWSEKSEMLRNFTLRLPCLLQVVKLVERYIDSRWDPWREVVKNETKSLVVEVCELYSISEKVIGDLIDRKQAQVCS